MDLQFVWWPHLYFGFRRMDERSPLYRMYRWALYLGPLEIRRWR
jgi:hypothetical protein